MRVYGIDFTSTPSRTKPITVAVCQLRPGELHLLQLLRIRDLRAFERSLQEPGPWIAAMDFPFGLPRQLIRDLEWPSEWTRYTRHVAALTRKEFENLLQLYMAVRPKGRKELRRQTDASAGALSPMKLHYVPLAKMYYEGAKRLEASSLNILPCRPTDDPRVVLEGYPGLAARQLIGRRSYKITGRSKQEQARHDARAKIVRALTGHQALDLYGFRVDIGNFLLEELVDDALGDHLDAVLCATQAGWALANRARGYGIPSHCDPREGWIVDPGNRPR